MRLEKMILNRLKKKQLMGESSTITCSGTSSSASSRSSNSSKASSSSSFFKCFSSSPPPFSSSDHHHLPPTDDQSSSAGVRRPKAGQGRGRVDEKATIFENVQTFTFNQLDMATDRFHPSKRIGEGGFGSVYKGRLEDGTPVAIKVLSAESRQGDREFMSELATLSHVTHDNLVHLIGGCVDGPRRMLVYEYMDNGNLAQNLLDNKTTLLNTWEVRKEIALGIAAGLAYLHGEIHPRIVHRDIKPTNILLDLDLRPKISDFGLSKFFPDDDITHITTRVAGTLGYLAPEYAISGHLTRKLDVYSFGVLLLEIVSGKTVVDFDQTLGEQYFLVERAWQMYKSDQMIQLVDPIMLKDGENSGFEEEAERFLVVALLCLQQKSSLRPTMSAALKMMNGTNEDGDVVEIMEPGLIGDFMAVKIGRRQQDKQKSSTATTTTEGAASVL
ncbi:unnamed protein product [Linum trigynum]|uniref:non-specific serine/threonine protein kinase n=1 Tax=Linum trigynum TaxID=586398 RepID=A0AAV2ENM2_9ROSI